ncbi:MAG: hypothetical protein ACK58T_17140, partial [Phycisphaerae bacterium]
LQYKTWRCPAKPIMSRVTQIQLREHCELLFYAVLLFKDAKIAKCSPVTHCVFCHPQSALTEQQWCLHRF